MNKTRLFVWRFFLTQSINLRTELSGNDEVQVTVNRVVAVDQEVVYGFHYFVRTTLLPVHLAYEKDNAWCDEDDESKRDADAHDGDLLEHSVVVRGLAFRTYTSLQASSFEAGKRTSRLFSGSRLNFPR